MALDQRQRDPLVKQLDGVHVAQLMRRESAARRADDHAGQQNDRSTTGLSSIRAGQLTPCPPGTVLDAARFGAPKAKGDRLVQPCGLNVEVC
jgi:hypothetical protein